MNLIAIQPFDGHQMGERITDAAQIEAILSDERVVFVNKVAAVDTAEEPPQE